MMNKTLVDMTFGSHLYGLSSPSSDRDYKGVYLPSFQDLLLQRFSKSVTSNTKQTNTGKNTSVDTDREFYSLHYFFELAKKGETVALDMLHAPLRACHTVTPEWAHLVSHRSLFYTKNLSSLVGYARKQASKYGVKGSRLADVRQVLDIVSHHSQWKIKDIMHLLPVTEHCGPMPHEETMVYNVCGRKLTLNAVAFHYKPMLENFIREYGERAKQAESNEGVDWKAVSHAFRAAFQVKGILKDGDFTYPLPETEFLRAVKSGALNFKTDVGPKLDALMDEVDALSKVSTLPERVDDNSVDALLLHILDMAYPMISKRG
jgi:hypothetical protein